MHAFARLFLPFLGWLRGYGRADLKADAVAGLTVALILVPQSMANAQLAGLPAYHGIYAALLPAAVAGLWGSSRQMVTGTVAVVSLMAAAALAPLAINSPGGYIAHMALLTMLVGGLQVLLGLLRLGMVVNFLSLPVISGFINASALIIFASQLGKFFGVTVDSSERQYQTLLATLHSAWYYTHWPSVSMGLLALVIMLLTARLAPKTPAVLIAVAVTTFLSWAMGFERTRTVALENIRSEEARAIVSRFNQELQELAAINENIARLRAGPAPTMAAQLEREYRVGEQLLFQERIQGNVHVRREHLRRMIFRLVPQTEGGALLYLIKSPSDESGLSGKAAGAKVIPVPAPGADAPKPESPAPPVSPDALSDIRPGAHPDGREWRIRVGAGPLDPGHLVISGGGFIVGDMPPGLPHFSMPEWSLANLLLLLPQAVIIAFVGFAESISIAKSAAARKGYRLDANQELIGQGLSNVSGGLILTCPVAGSFSSSAVNENAGARTGLSCVFAALGALITLLFLTGALSYLPEPVLAVVVMRAVGNLIHLDEFRRVWTAQWYDGVTAIVTFLATLYFAPHLDYGIGLGVLLSLAGFFYRAMRPRVITLSCGPDNTLRDAKVFGLEECRHIAIVHFQGALFFGNAGALEDDILRRLETNKVLRHIHLVCSGITSIDASGEDSLRMLVEKAHQAGVEMSFSGVTGAVAEVLLRTRVLHAVGWDNVFLTPREAVCAIHKRIMHDAGCTECPLTTIFCREAEMRQGYRSPNPVDARLAPARREARFLGVRVSRSRRKSGTDRRKK